MPRRCSPDLMVDWKICLPATVAGAVEFMLLDPLTKKPRYGQRSKIITAKLVEWLEDQGRRIQLVDEELPDPDLYPRKPKQ